MIVIDTKRLVIFCPPKCASNSLHNRFCKEDVGGITVVGTDPDFGPVGRHYCRPSYEWETYQHFAVVRNPFSRVVSLYHDYCRIRSYYGAAAPSFREFVQWLPRLHPNTAGEWFWNSSLCCCLRHVPESTRFIKLESIPEFCQQHALPLPGLDNASMSRAPREYYERWTTQRVQRLYEEDFHKFGYPTELA